MTLYLDSSAAAKLFVQEPESVALRAFLVEPMQAALVYASVLVETELRRMAMRLDIDQSVVNAALDRITLVTIPRVVYTIAGLLPFAHLRSLDALHVACAADLEATVLVSYDHRLVEAAELAGLRTASPA